MLLFHVINPLYGDLGGCVPLLCPFPSVSVFTFNVYARQVVKNDRKISILPKIKLHFLFFFFFFFFFFQVTRGNFCLWLAIDHVVSAG